MGMIPGVSVQTTRVFEFLVNREAGTQVAYAALCELTGKSLEQSRGNINSALNKLRNQHRQEWGTIRGVGIKRLADGEIVEKGAGQAFKMRKGLGRTLRVLECAEYDRLTADEKARHDALVIGSRTARLFLSGKGDALRRKLEIGNA